jgi:hypothetical protein
MQSVARVFIAFMQCLHASPRPQRRPRAVRAGRLRFPCANKATSGRADPCAPAGHDIQVLRSRPASRPASPSNSSDLCQGNVKRRADQEYRRPYVHLHQRIGRLIEPASSSISGRMPRASAATCKQRRQDQDRARAPPPRLGHRINTFAEPNDYTNSPDITDLRIKVKLYDYIKLRQDHHRVLHRQ